LLLYFITLSSVCESISGLKVLDGDSKSIHIIMSTLAGWKGKKRAVDINSRDEGIGGVSGIVLSLEEIGTGGSDV
jgi:hypothetical protein